MNKSFLKSTYYTQQFSISKDAKIVKEKKHGNLVLNNESYQYCEEVNDWLFKLQQQIEQHNKRMLDLITDKKNNNLEKLIDIANTDIIIHEFEIQHINEQVIKKDIYDRSHILILYKINDYLIS